MGIGSLGFSELAVIFVIVLVFFGPKRFPEIARSMGHAMREFRRSLNQIQRELEEADPRSSIPGRDILKDIRSGKPGKWLDPDTPDPPDHGASGAGRAATPSSAGGDRPDDSPVSTVALTSAEDDPDPAQQLPMFDAADENSRESTPPPTDGRPTE